MKNKAPEKPKLPQRPSPCFGPLADLETHLPEEWWRTLFNSIYLKTDADVVENNENTKQEISILLTATGTKKDARVLDLCCGQGRHSLEMARQGFSQVTGIDRSRYLIRLARKRSQDENFNSLLFREGDARSIRYPDRSFDLVMVMGNSFGYFEREEENLQVLKEIFRLLDSEGTLFLDVTDGEWMSHNFSPNSWEWIDQNSLVCRERHLSADRLRLISREVVVDAMKGVVKDQFYAERLYKAHQLLEALENAGFISVKMHGKIQAQSSRVRGDLGMMGNRLLITAHAPKKIHLPPRIKGLKKVPLPCTVLLGDPKLPDTVKRGGIFNLEDLETVQKMKTALSSLEEFRFHYFDDHKNFTSQLTRNPPKFVFNLCDEGLNNDPLKELHVPALLETVGIPYTGGNPACLALCYNKGLVRILAKELEIPTPDELWIDSKNSSAAIPNEFPAFVKPVFGDSSIGITQKAVIKSADELIAYCDWLRNTLPGTPLLIQEYLPGQEYSVGVIGNEGDLTFLPILEVDYSKLPDNLPPILGYESKWLPDSPYWNTIEYKQASLGEGVIRTLYDQTALLFSRLGCRDYARFDFRADRGGVIKLLEVNPNPGWCWDGKLNLMAQYLGWDYPTLLGKILQAGRERLKL